MQSTNFSELWKNLDWRKVRKTVFRLQIRLFKAMRAKDNARVRNLQNLILRSRSARLLAIRQVTQLNAGRKTAGVTKNYDKVGQSWTKCPTYLTRI